MRFRFIGTYTGGRTTITVFGVTFTGHDPAEVAEAEAVARLSGNIEFEAVEDEPRDEPEADKPKRGRPRKVKADG